MDYYYTDRQKDIYELRSKGKSFAEIAKTFNLSKSAVITIFYRCEKRDEKEQFEKIFSELTDKQKKIYLMKKEGNSFLEIAKELNISKSTVKTIFYRIEKKINFETSNNDLKEYTEEEFINIFKKIINKGLISNTYKFAFGKAIIDIARRKKQIVGEKLIIKLSEISELFFNYYWNEIVDERFFQSSNIEKPPKIYTIVLNYYNNSEKVFQKSYFENIKNELIFKNEEEYYKLIDIIVKILKENVVYRFLILDKIEYKLYSYDLNQNIITLSTNYIRYLKNHGADIIIDINNRWLEITQKYEEKNKGIIKNKEKYVIEGTNVVIKINNKDKLKIIKI